MKQSQQSKDNTPPSLPSGKAKMRGRVRKRANDQAPSDFVGRDEAVASGNCINCGVTLSSVLGLRLCDDCNSPGLHAMADEFRAISENDSPLDTILEMDNETLMIECPGATRYDESTGAPLEGADFIEGADGKYTIRIVGNHIFPPTHTKRRVIARDAYGRIRRCQACQDYTVRLRRREGVDFCIPSRRYPHRDKLRTVDDDITHRRK